MLVPTFAHQIADAFIHGNASRGNQAGHTGYDAVITGRDHVRTAAENGYELEHVEVVGSEDRSAGEEFQHRAARNGIKAFHSDQNRKHPVTLEKRRGGFAKTGNVVAIFPIDFSSGFVEINGAI